MHGNTQCRNQPASHWLLLAVRIIGESFRRRWLAVGVELPHRVPRAIKGKVDSPAHVITVSPPLRFPDAGHLSAWRGPAPPTQSQPPSHCKPKQAHRLLLNLRRVDILAQLNVSPCYGQRCLRAPTSPRLWRAVTRKAPLVPPLTGSPAIGP
ncbi:hypothetical protein MHYP_G00322300 [Metynnis hypsauchen]